MEILQETDLLKEILPKPKYLETLEKMLLTRYMDEKMAKLVRQNKGTTFHLAVSGHEMVGVVCADHLRVGTDWAFPYYRDRAFALGLGCPLVDILASFLARDAENHSGGRMMPEHFSDVKRRIPCQSSVVGSQFLQAVGLAKAICLSGDDEVVYVSGGEGSTSQGDFHEALNFSCIHNLPCIFVIQDNGWAISVPRKEQTAGDGIASIAKGYEGLQVLEVDGCDYIQLNDAMKKAVKKARAKQGPSVLVAKIPRIAPHSSSDDPKKYKDDDVLEEEIARDPIVRFENWLLQNTIVSQKEIDDLKVLCREEIEEASLKADSLPFPDVKEAATKVYKPFSPPCSKKVEGETIVMMDALNHALSEEMEKSEKVVVFGQDVAHGKGGVFGITRHLTDKFGKERCFNTPLAESTIVGIATGMSFKGYRPVAEIQFADYSWTAMNQLINEVASIYYRSNGTWACPIVVRMPYGGYIQGGPYHSQSIEGYLTHCPGLKVVVPSNAADAKMLLKTAILDPNPVVFLEHKGLYRQHAFSARPETAKENYLPFGKAEVVLEGDDLTLIGWGMMVNMGHEVCQSLKKEGISVELIDLRTLTPLDIETILKSIKKTSKVLIAHEASKTSGFGAEIAARIVEEAFYDLDAPVQRLCGKDCMVPFCKKLEDEVLPQKKDLEEAIRALYEY